VDDDGGADRVAPNRRVASEQVGADQDRADPEHPERIPHRSGRGLKLQAAR
jgi:hypothetical protein